MPLPPGRGPESYSADGVTHTPEGCEFRRLAAGRYAVSATLLEKSADGRWLPGKPRFRGTAFVGAGARVVCLLARE